MTQLQYQFTQYLRLSRSMVHPSWSEMNLSARLDARKWEIEERMGD